MSVTEREILYNSTHELPGIKFIEGRSRMVVSKGWEGEIKGSSLMGIEFVLSHEKRSGVGCR